MKRKTVLIAVLVAAVAAIVFLAPALSKKSEEAQTGTIAQAVDEKSGGAVSSSLVTEAPLRDDFVEGKSSAPITVIEYASLSCPHCAAFHNEVYPDFKKNYIETGKARYILRPFPLNEPALKGAVLAQCAGQEGGAERYYTFARVLFDAQNKWAFDANYVKALESFALVGGMSREEFERCMTDTEVEKHILTIRKSAQDELKVPHTPYFIINGMPFQGKATKEGFFQRLDGVLAGKQG